jgi:hypothetical protein
VNCNTGQQLNVILIIACSIPTSNWMHGWVNLSLSWRWWLQETLTGFCIQCHSIILSSTKETNQEWGFAPKVMCDNTHFNIWLCSPKYYIQHAKNIKKMKWNEKCLKTSQHTVTGTPHGKHII